ncbi:MAG: hypothetical protein FWG16_08390 [Micrococcales bacterium]|nr:hypothetical protein [Micrococcales bacterium]
MLATLPLWTNQTRPNPGVIALAKCRSAAFARVVATGGAFDADSIEPSAPSHALHVTRTAGSLMDTANALRRSAAKSHAGTLD